MSSFTTCPACHYTRQPTDDAPDWECPKCQKAYIKTRGALLESGGVTTIPESASSNCHEKDLVSQDEINEKIKTERQLFFVIIILLLFLSPILSSGVTHTKSLLRNYRLEKYGMRAVGTVVDHKYSRSGGRHSHSQVTPVITFPTNDGKQITFQSRYWDGKYNYPVGSAIGILYLAQQPEAAEVNQQDYLWDGFAREYRVIMFFTVFLGGPALLLLYAVMKSRKERLQLKRQ